MRQYTKNQILESVKSLFQANQLLKKLIVKKKSRKLFSCPGSRPTAGQATEVMEVFEKVIN